MHLVLDHCILEEGVEIFHVIAKKVLYKKSRKNSCTANQRKVSSRLGYSGGPVPWFDWRSYRRTLLRWKNKARVFSQENPHTRAMRKRTVSCQPNGWEINHYGWKRLCISWKEFCPANVLVWIVLYDIESFQLLYLTLYMFKQNMS